MADTAAQNEVRDIPQPSGMTRGFLLKLHDEARRPAVWTECMSGDEVAVFLSDVESGAEMTLDGGMPKGDERGTCRVFASLEQALEFARRQTGRVARMRCDVFDRRGRAVVPLATVVNPKFSHVIDETRSSRRLIAGGWAALAASAGLVTLEWQSTWSAGLLGVLAVNALAISGRLLMWGYGQRAGSGTCANAGK